MELKIENNKLIMNGKEITLTDEQLEELGIFKTSFDVEHGDIVYFVDRFGNIGYFEYSEEYSEDVELLKSGKICKDKKLMEQKALHQNLNDLLCKFTLENGWSDDLWECEVTEKWSIRYEYTDKRFYAVWGITGRSLNVIYFISKEIAQRAIDEIVKPYMKEHPEFVW